MKKWQYAAAGAMAVLAGCGGSSDGADTTTRTTVSSVKVFGDSIADSGTFGYKLTIQSANPADPFLIIPERVAATFGFSKLCSFFNFNAAAATYVPNTACTNYAVSGGRVNNLTNADAPGTMVPLSIPFQMGAGSAALTPTDMVIIDGGSNDLADILSAYLKAGTPAGLAAYQAALGTLLPAATVTGTIGSPTPASLAAVGSVYAQALAQALVASINTNVLSRGVKKVVVMNSSDFTKTPRFQAVLAGVAAAGGTAQRDATQAAATAWIQSFNTTLAQGLSGTGVMVFDFFTEANRIYLNPAQYLITNVTTPACPVVAGGVDPTTGQASLFYAPTVAACNSVSMSSSIPVGMVSADWWKRYFFADNFHPTPVLHQLIAQAMSVQMARAGWI